LNRTNSFAGRPLLSLSELTGSEVAELCRVAEDYGRSPESWGGGRVGARVGLLFTAPSTRTRSTFWSAATTLGCDILHFGPADLQVSTGETWADTGAVLANVLDAVVVRTNGPQHELRELATTLPATVNALTYQEHPTQAIADMCALREHFGAADGLRLAYLGQVNNTARALALLVCKTPGMRLDVYTPPSLGFTPEEIDTLNETAGATVLRQFDHLPNDPDEVDAVYTTRWQSMGVTPDDPDWLARLRPFTITTDTMSLFGRSARFLHDLPAVREQEVTSEVLDGPTSLVPRQAYHKTSAAAAALLWTLGREETNR
jgi:ornithine carbamoyltransferase